MAKTYPTRLEFTSSEKGPTKSDVVNFARKHFARRVEFEVARAKKDGLDPREAVRRCFEDIVRRAAKIASDHGHEGNMELRAYNLLRTLDPERGLPSGIIAVEAIAKAAGVWDASPEDMSDPYETWDKVFATAEEIAIFSHAHPDFWTADRLRAQVAIRARMLATGLPRKVRRLLVLPDDSARAELAELGCLVGASEGQPPDELVSDAHGQRAEMKKLLVKFPIETRHVRKGPFKEMWDNPGAGARRYLSEAPVSSILWRKPGDDSMSAMVWELDQKRRPVVIRKLSRPDHVENFRAFFEEAFEAAGKGGDGWEQVVPGTPRHRSELARRKAARESVP